MGRPVTNKEMEVAELVTFGMLEKEISEHLHMSVNTVKVHKRNIYNKLGCKKDVDLARWYLQRKCGVRLEPKPAIRKYVAFFFLIIVMVSEFQNLELLRVRTCRAPRPVTKTIRSRTRSYRNELNLLSA